MKHQFDLFIWSELLKIHSKETHLPTMERIMNQFGVSQRIARAYLFALENRDMINPDPEISKKLGKSLNTIKDLRRTKAKLTTENEILEAKVNFLLALEEHVINTKPVAITANGKNKYETTAVALFSDSHIEERVDPLVVNGLNEYNPKIAADRVHLYFRRMMWLIESWRKGGITIDKLVLGILGDTISGYIHEELLEGNFMSPTEAVTFMQDLLVAGIQYLADVGKFKEIIVVCKFGNHSRTSKKKKFSTGWKNSYEFLMYTQIQKLFRDHKLGYEHINFVIEKGEFTQVQVYHKLLNFSHGDHFGYQGGIGGVLIPFNRWIHKMDSVVKADKYYIAHWHSLQNLNRGVMNGSVIGYSPFAMGHAFNPEPPMQHLELIDSKRGFIYTAPIILEDWK